MISLFLLGVVTIAETAVAQNGTVQNNGAPVEITEESGMAPVYEGNFIDTTGSYAGDCCPTGDCCGYYGCGVFPFIKDVAETALSPVYFVASLFSAGVYPGCGCAPRYQRVYRDPCDQCGNWVGSDVLLGHPRQPCQSCQNGSAPAYNYGNYENSELWENNSAPIQNQSAPAAQPIQKSVPAKIDAVKSGARQMQSGPTRIAVQAPAVAIPFQNNGYKGQSVKGNSGYQARNYQKNSNRSLFGGNSVGRNGMMNSPAANYPVSGQTIRPSYYQTKSNVIYNGAPIRPVSGNAVQYQR